MAENRRDEAGMSNEMSYRQDWEHDSAPSSILSPSSPSTVVAAERRTSYVERKPVEVTQYDGAGISLMEADVSRSLRSPSPTPRYTRSIFKSWVWEIMSCFAALTSLVTLVVILDIYNGSALDAWEHTITINSIISILVTIMKASVVLPLAEGLSQLKWVWFDEQERSLKDLVVFDEASRGVIGASKLILFVKPWYGFKSAIESWILC